MKTNWKKEYEDYIDYIRRHRNQWDKDEKWLYSILITSIVCGLILISFTLVGVFDSPIEKLGIDENWLAREHVLSYYHEFENCSIEYDGCIGSDKHGFCKKGVEIYCEKLDSRDNLRVQRKTEPTEILYLDGITLKDILLNIIERRCI